MKRKISLFFMFLILNLFISTASSPKIKPDVTSLTKSLETEMQENIQTEEGKRFYETLSPQKQKEITINPNSTITVRHINTKGISVNIYEVIASIYGFNNLPEKIFINDKEAILVNKKYYYNSSSQKAVIFKDNEKYEIICIVNIVKLLLAGGKRKEDYEDRMVICMSYESLLKGYWISTEGNRYFKNGKEDYTLKEKEKEQYEQFLYLCGSYHDKQKIIVKWVKEKDIITLKNNKTKIENLLDRLERLNLLKQYSFYIDTKIKFMNAILSFEEAIKELQLETIKEEEKEQYEQFLYLCDRYNDEKKNIEEWVDKNNIITLQNSKIKIEVLLDRLEQLNLLKQYSFYIDTKKNIVTTITFVEETIKKLQEKVK